MNTEHSDVAAELWALAETVLTRLEPVLKQAMEEQRERPRQGCSWCPVCALAALMRGEQHDLLTLVATEGATVIAMIRRLVAEHSAQTSGTTHTPSNSEGGVTGDVDGAESHVADPPVASDTEDPVVGRSGFVPITVTVKDSARSNSIDPQT